MDLKAKEKENYNLPGGKTGRSLYVANFGWYVFKLTTLSIITKSRLKFGSFN